MELAIGVFIAVYLGMFFGGLPGLALDRTGVALLGAVALIVGGAVTPIEAWGAVDVSTIGLLFGLMVVSAQLRAGGFYAWVTRRIVALTLSPRAFLAAVMGASAGLSAVLTNDVICLAMTPILVDGCGRRGLNPVPHLLGLACATNIGSALTLIGNPQNMLIGQSLGLHFGGYMLEAALPVFAGMMIAWAIICFTYRGAWQGETRPPLDVGPPFNRWHTVKGLLIVVTVMALFLADAAEREVVALGAAALVLTSRKLSSREMIGLVDWHLLVLFVGLFVVNGALTPTGAMDDVLKFLADRGIDLANPWWLFVGSAVLSNIVSNVPATMLLLPTADFPHGGAILALSSTFAGNMFVVGSIANIIVVEQARRMGIDITWKEHARVGVPVSILTLAAVGLWIAIVT